MCLAEDSRELEKWGMRSEEWGIDCVMVTMGQWEMMEGWRRKLEWQKEKKCARDIESGFPLLWSDIARAQKVWWCMHKHWKNCFDVSEAHMFIEQWVEEPVRRAEEQMCIAQLVSEHQLLCEDDDTGSYAGRMRTHDYVTWKSQTVACSRSKP
jgi:hypothetical protein